MRNNLTIIIKFRTIDDNYSKNISNLGAQVLVRNLQNNIQNRCLHALISLKAKTVINYLSIIYKTVLYSSIKYDDKILNIKWLFQDDLITKKDLSNKRFEEIVC